METSTPPSFIPHDTVQQTTSFSRRTPAVGGLADILLVIAIILCGASGAVAGGVFLYGQYLDRTAASKLTQLQRAQAALDPSTFEQFIRLDDRMNVAGTLLQGHLAPALFFDMLNQTTLTTVSFSSLDMDVNDSNQIQIKMAGVARGVNSIALQSELFGKNTFVSSPIFSGISRQQDGVHFSVSASLKPGSLAYARAIAGTSTPADISTPAVAPEPSGTPSPFERAATQPPAPTTPPVPTQ